MEMAASGLSRKLKVVMLGDGAMGKTYIIKSYIDKECPQETINTAFDNFTAEFSGKIGGKQETVQLTLFDSGGQEGYDELRRLFFPDADVVIMVASVVWPDSFENIEAKWKREARYYLPQKPVILVGSMIDLRGSQDQTDWFVRKLAASGQQAISYGEGVSLARKIGAKAYVECSAKTGEGLTEVFTEAVKAFFKEESKRIVQAQNKSTCFSSICCAITEDDHPEIELEG